VETDAPRHAKQAGCGVANARDAICIAVLRALHPILLRASFDNRFH
jgi:hypothetical protein